MFNSPPPFGAILEEKWNPRWSLKSIKIYKNAGPKFDIKLVTFRMCFFWEFDLIFGAFPEASGLQNLAFRVRHPSKFWKSSDVTSDVEKISFRSDFGAILVPSWGPKWSQNRYKWVLEKWWKNDADQDGAKIAYRFLFHWAKPRFWSSGRRKQEG